MNYSSLSAQDILRFTEKRKSRSKQVSYSVWIEGLGDVTLLTLRINIDRRIDNEGIYYSSKVNSCQLVLYNKDHQFFDFVPQYKIGSRVKVWAGFDGINVPIFTGIIVGYPSVSENLEQLVITCYDYMSLMALMTFTQDYTGNRPSFYEIINYLCSQNAVINNVSNTGDFAIELQRAWFDTRNADDILIDLATVLGSIAYFDEDGGFNISKLSYYNYVDEILDDKILGNITPLVPSTIINCVDTQYALLGYTKSYNNDSIVTNGLKQLTYKSIYFNNGEFDTDHVSYHVEFDVTAYRNIATYIFINFSVVDSLSFLLYTTATKGWIKFHFYEGSSGAIPNEPTNLVCSTERIDANNIPKRMDWVTGKILNGYHYDSTKDIDYIVLENRLTNGNLYMARNIDHNVKEVWVATGSSDWENYTEFSTVAENCVAGDMLFRVNNDNGFIAGYPILIAEDTAREERKTLLGVQGNWLFLTTGLEENHTALQADDVVMTLQDNYCSYYIDGSSMANSFNEEILNKYKKPNIRFASDTYLFPEVQLFDTFPIRSDKFNINAYGQITRIIHNIKPDISNTRLHFWILDDIH